LLEQWIGESSRSFRLSRKAQVRLIAALDKNIPCWFEKHDAGNQKGSYLKGVLPIKKEGSRLKRRVAQIGSFEKKIVQKVAMVC